MRPSNDVITDSYDASSRASLDTIQATGQRLVFLLSYFDRLALQHEVRGKDHKLLKRYHNYLIG